MTTRSSSSSSSSSSETEVTTGRLHTRSPTNTIDGTSIGETATIRSASPSASHISSIATGTVYDTASIATTTKTGITNTTATTQSAGGIPIIRPPVLHQQQAGTGIGVLGPQRPLGYPVQPPIVPGGVANRQGIQIDVAAAQQQYQQLAGQPAASVYSSSSTSSSGASLSSPGTASYQQPRFDAAKAMFNQADLNKDGSISRQEFRQWAQGNPNQSGAQFQQQQQAQFANQIPAHQVYNELLGPDAFKDVILDIDYGALGGFNVAFQSPEDLSGGQLPPGINIRPAYTTVDSLNYQQHMFNTARTINAGGDSSHFGFSGAASGYDVTGGQQFDIAKAMFNQADANRDGGISREEFQQWAQGGQPNYGGQSYAAEASYQTNTANYGAASGNNPGGFFQAGLFDGANPDIANILQQSGLGQVVPN